MRLLIGDVALIARTHDCLSSVALPVSLRVGDFRILCAGGTERREMRQIGIVAVNVGSSKPPVFNINY